MTRTGRSLSLLLDQWKDGTSIEGTVIKFGTQYRIKTADGQTKIVPESQVKEVVK
jgi:hypothetical protein